jgi:hypothetical protein
VREFALLLTAFPEAKQGRHLSRPPELVVENEEGKVRPAVVVLSSNVVNGLQF